MILYYFALMFGAFVLKRREYLLRRFSDYELERWKWNSEACYAKLKQLRAKLLRLAFKSSFHVI